MALTVTKSRFTASLLGLLLTLFVLLLQTDRIPVLAELYQRLELIAYDQRMRLHSATARQGGAKVVIVDIDETALREQGRWPWSRKRIAELVKRLADAGAVVVAFDVLFAEHERNPAQELIDYLAVAGADDKLQRQLELLTPQLDADRTLAAAMSRVDVILGYSFSRREAITSGRLPTPLPLQDPDSVSQLSLQPMAGYATPLELLQQTARGSGFFSLNPDPDGVVRRAPLLVRYGDNLYGSLALEAVRHYLFLDELRLETAAIGSEEQIEALRLDQANVVPTDGEGRMLVPFRGKAGSFPYLSAHHVLTGEHDPELLTGAIVLVGTTAAGLYDLRATPLSHVYPGVEVHANLIAAMLDNRYLVQPSWAEGADFLLTLLLGLLLALLMPRLRIGWLLLLTVLAGLSLLVVTGWFWLQRGFVLELTAPLLLIALLSATNLAWGYFYESLTRYRLKGMFSQYVPPELVNRMSERPEAYGTAGETRELSVLFSDIRGFTSISETLAAEELKRFLNQFFTPMTRIIFNNHGTIDKYVGDMVMAFWGAPVNDAEHASHAVEAALQMLSEAERLKRRFAERGWPQVEIGIGINSGMMNVGDMGSEYRRAYTVLGDAVNLASRLEGSTKYYGVALVVGEKTRQLAGEQFVYRELDLVRVKGKAQAIRVYQPVCRSEEAEPQLLDELALLEQGLTSYRSRDWDGAQQLFSHLQQLRPDIYLYRLYQERIATLRDSAPDVGWDGVFVRSEK